jgi:hypothetical protein
MTGTMHLATFSSSLIGVLEQSIVEIQHGHVTNENPAKEVICKVEKILHLWQLRHGHYTWGSNEKLGICKGLLQV